MKPIFSPWLDSKDGIVVANAMILILQRTMAMLKNQIKQQGDVFLEQGGFRERMYKSRSAVRDDKTALDENAPACPECGKPMRKRSAQQGRYSGSEFWGCSAYPECKGIVNVDATDVVKRFLD